MAKNSNMKGRRITRPSKFTVETLESLADDLKSKRIPLKRLVIGDEVQQGLRAIISQTGTIAFHVHYRVKDSRPWMKMGEHPDMKIPAARKLAATIIALGEKGVDVQDALHDKLIRELEAKGENWKP